MSTRALSSLAVTGLSGLILILWGGVTVAQEAAPPPPAVSSQPNLVGTFPLPGEVFDRRIIFYFDQPLAAVADPSTLINIDPPLEGTWTQGTNHVALTVTAEKPEPGVYRASFQPALTNTSGQMPAPPASPLLFANRQLVVQSCDFSEVGLTTVALKIVFSLPVTPDQLRQHLSITDASSVGVEYGISAEDSRTTHRIILDSTVAPPLTISISEGLVDAAGTFAMNSPFQKNLSGPGTFLLSNFTWNRSDDTMDRIEFQTSSTVTVSDMLEHLQIFGDDSIEPVTLTRAADQPTDRIALEFERPADPFNVLRYVFAPGLSQLSPMIPQKEQTGTITMQRDELRIDYHNWDSRGIQPMRLQLYFNSTVSAEQVQKHLTVTPAVAGMKVETGEYGGVDVLGEWVAEQAYRVQISAGLRDQFDLMVAEKAINWNVNQAPRRSGVGFASEEPYYFPRRQMGPLSLQARNLEKATVTLYQLFPSNVVKALDYLEKGKAASTFGYEFARKVAEMPVTFENKKDVLQTVPVPMDGFMPEGKKGIYGLAVQPGYDYYNTKIVVWTDIGVLAHWQEDQLLVYAHNLWNLAPLADAKVTLYSAKHQVMGEVTTGPDGVARLADWDQELGRPRVVIVESADDFTFLPLNERSDDPVAYSDGMPAYTKGYDAFLYMDRNLYRPGETMHLRWLVRQADGSPLKDAPMRLRVVDANGNEKEFTNPLSAWGSGSLDLETTNEWLTGAYTVDLWVPGADMPLTSQTFNVEDFVPQRIAVTATAGAPWWLPGDTHPVTINAEQLSGGPARERKTSAAVILEKGTWKPEGWSEYVFTNEAPYNGDLKELGEATTDGLGQAGFTFKWQPGKELTFPVEATIRGEVFEAGGRGVAGRTTAFLFPAPDVLGLAVASGAKANTVDIAVAAVRPDGAPSALDSVEVTLEKKEWSYYVRRFDSHNEANWTEGFVKVKTETVPLKGGKGAVALPFKSDYGTYRVRVHRADSRQFASVSFWSNNGQAQVMDGSRPSLIKLTPDKPAYVLGETASVRIESPFDGNAIVVLQGGTIDQAVTVPIAQGAGVFTLPLEARHVPNIWLEATVIHPVEPGTPLTYPYASFAMVNIPVSDPSKALAINFPSLPTVIRPLTQLDVNLTVAGADGLPVASEVTLALVDEGIHQILQYQNPDPAAWFMRARRPDFRRAHYYDQVAYDFQGAKIGGDGLLRKRLGEDDATIGDNWIQPLALWSGTVETDATGAAKISMAVPEFNGKVRLVAVATTGDRAGSQAANVTVRRPVILRTSLPRFAGPGDTFAATVNLQNMLDTPIKVTLKSSASAPVMMANSEKVVELAAGAESVFTLPAGAGDVTGSGKIHFALSAVDGAGTVVEEFTVDTPLMIQSPSVYQVRSELAVIPAGESREFVNTEFKENSVLESSLSATPNPLARLRKALDYVIGYPYGCVEQTTSRCLPLFLLGQAAANAGNELDAQQFQQFIQAGIDRLLAMQTRNGGLGYWPGATESSIYGSIYGAHFLALARQDGAFQVPDDKFQALMTYLKERVPLDPKDGPRDLYNYAYACYVRALGQDPTVMESVNNMDSFSVPTAARQWLALAGITATGNAKQAVSYLLKRPSEPYTAREQSGSLNSPIRNDAITLMTQMAVGLDATVVQPQAEKLLRYLEGHRYSTQEAAFVVTALSAYLRSYSGDLTTAHASFLSPGGTAEEKGDFQYRYKHTGPGGKFAVTNSGKTPLYVHFNTAGILVNPDVQAASNGIKLARRLEGKEGPADPADLKHGENYLVSLEITCDQTFENVVLADLLPGGLEIENPRLDGAALAAWKKKDGVLSNFLEMRDDRMIAAFDRLETGTHRFYYVVRAVTPGTFQHPGANAECMYETKFNARTEAGSVTIAP